MYEYRATLVRWVDADTCVVDIDLGFRQWMHGEHLRLVGIDAPDRNPAKAAATAYARTLVPIGTRIVIRTQKDAGDKYGRWLCAVYGNPDNGTSLNQILVDAGHAVPWDGLGGHPEQATGVTP